MTDLKGIIFVSPDIFEKLHESASVRLRNLVFAGETKVFNDPMLPEKTIVGDPALIDHIEREFDKIIEG